MFCDAKVGNIITSLKILYQFLLNIKWKFHSWSDLQHWMQPARVASLPYSFPPVFHLLTHNGCSQWLGTDSVAHAPYSSWLDRPFTMTFFQKVMCWQLVLPWQSHIVSAAVDGFVYICFDCVFVCAFISPLNLKLQWSLSSCFAYHDCIESCSFCPDASSFHHPFLTPVQPSAFVLTPLLHAHLS